MALYTLLLGVGYRHSIKEHKKATSFVFILKDVIEEIKHIIYKEEDEDMEEKGTNKNTGSLEPKKIELENGFAFIGNTAEWSEPETTKNTLTLTDLVTNKPTDADYAEIVGLLTKLAKVTYENYNFLIVKSTDEVEDTHFIQMVSSATENHRLHRDIFVKAINTNVDYKELVKRFAAHVAAGNVIHLGDDVVVITDDGTNMLPTGVSPINNGLEDSQITFNISFIKKENLDAFNKKHLPQDDSNE